MIQILNKIAKISINIFILFQLTSCQQSEKNKSDLLQTPSSENGIGGKENVVEMPEVTDHGDNAGRKLPVNNPQSLISSSSQKQEGDSRVSGYLKIIGIKKEKENSIDINEEVALTVEYSFNGAGNVVINWRSNGGSFVGPSDGKSVKWQAPNIVGKYRIDAIFRLSDVEFATSTDISVINLSDSNILFHSYYEIIDGAKYNWMSPIIHGKEALNGFSLMCAKCHGEDGRGNNNINLSCFKCHNFPHPGDFKKTHVHTNIKDISRNCTNSCHINRKGRVLQSVCNNIACHK